MPAKNSVKSFVEDGSYHVYNKGIENRRIFEESKDYEKFLFFLKIYLTPVEIITKEFPLLKSHIINGNLADKIDLLAFCLMPNHFHLLVHQKTKDATTKLMRQLSTAYSMYFNEKYQRSGRLFQGIYKACRVEGDEYLLHVSRYIHQNPKERGVALPDFPWSSYPAYIGTQNHNWLKPELVLSYFSKLNNNFTYKSFIETSDQPSPDISNLVLE